MHASKFLRPCRFLICVLLMLTGCASDPKPPRMPPGPFAVAPARFAPQAELNLYARGKGAAAGNLAVKGATEGALAGAVVPLGMGPFGVAAYPIIAPFTVLAGVAVGGTFGAGYGAMHGLPAEQADQVSMLADQAINQIGVHEQVARRVVERSHRGGMNVVLLSQAGPRKLKEKPDYADQKPDFRAVLELAVEKIGMAARKGEIPRIALEMTLQARIVMLSEVGIAGDKQLEWAGKPHPLDEWQTGGAKMLAAEFEQGYETLAQYVWEILVMPDKPSTTLH